MTYSISASSMFSIDDDGKHSLEVTYKDSDGFSTGAYAEGDNFDAVLADVLDQIDEAKADRDDARANEEEATQLQVQIDDLTRQLEELKARNAELEKKNNKYKKYQNFEDAVSHIYKDIETDNLWKRWFQ